MGWTFEKDLGGCIYVTVVVVRVREVYDYSKVIGLSILVNSSALNRENLVGETTLGTGDIGEISLVLGVLYFRYLQIICIGSIVSWFVVRQI